MLCYLRDHGTPHKVFSTLALAPSPNESPFLTFFLILSLSLESDIER